MKINSETESFKIKKALLARIRQLADKERRTIQTEAEILLEEAIEARK